jgi:hypothetical protein
MRSCVHTRSIRGSPPLPTLSLPLAPSRSLSLSLCCVSACLCIASALARRSLSLRRPSRAPLQAAARSPRSQFGRSDVTWLYTHEGGSLAPARERLRANAPAFVKRYEPAAEGGSDREREREREREIKADNVRARLVKPAKRLHDRRGRNVWSDPLNRRYFVAIPLFLIMQRLRLTKLSYLVSTLTAALDNNGGFEPTRLSQCFYSLSLSLSLSLSCLSLFDACSLSGRLDLFKPNFRAALPAPHQNTNFCFF